MNGPVKNFALVLYTAGIEDRLDILTEAQPAGNRASAVHIEVAY